MQEYQYDDNEIEIDLVELFQILKKKMLMIVASVILFSLIAVGVTKWLITPIYASTVQLYILPRTGTEETVDLSAGIQLTQDYMIIATTATVLDQVIEELDLEMSSGELSNNITVENPEETRIMKITVKDSSPKRAKKIAQKLANITSKTVSSIMGIEKPVVIENATEPGAPVGISNMLIIATGALFGLVLALTIVFIQFMMDDTISKEEDVEKYLGINMLARLPLQKGEKKRKKKVRKAGNIV